MNLHWLEKQKLRVNKARYREPGHQCKSPSNYIIHKMELLSLIYSYTDTETVQAIMQEVHDSWASVINPQYQKTIQGFQSGIKYHEESWKNWSLWFPNHNTCLIGNIPVPAFLTENPK